MYRQKQRGRPRPQQLALAYLPVGLPDRPLTGRAESSSPAVAGACVTPGPAAGRVTSPPSGGADLKSSRPDRTLLRWCGGAGVGASRGRGRSARRQPPAPADDLAIAATATEEQVPPLTNNLADFEIVEGL